jgi:hypothetical protein
MKYTRMVCWVRPHEKIELKNAVNNQFPLVFAKNYDDFRNKITPNSYLVISLSKAKFGLKKLQNLVRLFPNNIFTLYEVRNNDLITNSEYAIMNENNVTDGQYGAIELRDNYLNIIPDLWKHRCKQKPIILPS